jgi:ribA/ribD-fused uncharacterized protein
MTDERVAAVHRDPTDEAPWAPSEVEAAEFRAAVQAVRILSLVTDPKLEAEAAAEEPIDGSPPPAGEVADAPLFFRSHRVEDPSGGVHACFSNWFDSPFVDDVGRGFANAEQFLMHRKAMTFGDEATAAAMLAEPDPARVKALGRRVAPYDDARWSEYRYRWMVDGLRRKFEHHPNMAAVLLGTGDRLLAEASADDTVWGIGLNLSDALACDTAELNRRLDAGNLLGKALMEVRSLLRFRRDAAAWDAAGHALPYYCAQGRGVNYQLFADLLEEYAELVPEEEREVVCSRTGHRWRDLDLVKQFRNFPTTGGFEADFEEELEADVHARNGRLDTEQLAFAFATIREELDNGWVLMHRTRADVHHARIRESPLFYVPKMKNLRQKEKAVMDFVNGVVADGVHHPKQKQWRHVDHHSHPGDSKASLNEVTSMSIPCTLDDVPYASGLLMGLKGRHGRQRASALPASSPAAVSGPEVELWTADVKSAYRLGPLARSVRHQFYFKFLDVTKPIPAYVLRGEPIRDDDCIWYEKQSLPFGWARSVEWWVRVSKALKTLFLWEQTPGLDEHQVPRDVQDAAIYIDDLLGMALKGWGRPTQERYLALCEMLGIPISKEKLEEDGAVGVVCPFLGVLFDAVKEELRLSPEKLAEGLRRIRAVAGKKSLPRKQLASLVGVLSFAASVSPPCRIFMRRLLDKLKHTQGKRFVRLGRPELADLAWFRSFWTQWNGKSLCLAELWEDAEELGFWTDASMDGFGACFLGPNGPEYFGGRWADYGIDPRAAGMHISELEALALALAVETWGHYLSGRRVSVRVDNEACVTMVNNRNARDPGMMHSMRNIFFEMARNSFELGSRWISTKDNVLADAASRSDWKRFFEFARSEFGFEPADMREVVPTTDIGLQLRKIKKARAAAAAHEARRAERKARRGCR